MTDLDHLSPEYVRALADHDSAVRDYTEACERYRGGDMTDAEFLNHRAIKMAADAEFDRAFERESNR
ncbi:MAG: hypothetical protein QNJ92_06800 [Alphaproteobacteria bacterium]|nr:hypothetical protein [Alphaproteobacteria bacterium]